MGVYARDARAFNVPSPHQEPGQPPRMYIREHRRIVGDYVHTANDFAATDGTTPRSTNTIAMASYAMDHHHKQHLLDTSTTPHSVWNEGNVEDTAGGGVDKLAPSRWKSCSRSA